MTYLLYHDNFPILAQMALHSSLLKNTFMVHMCTYNGYDMYQDICFQNSPITPMQDIYFQNSPITPASS